MTLVFNSKESPGNVVVKDETNKTLGIITIIRKDAGDFREGDRYFIPMSGKHYMVDPSYKNLKQRVIDSYLEGSLK